MNEKAGQAVGYMTTVLPLKILQAIINHFFVFPIKRACCSLKTRIEDRDKQLSQSNPFLLASGK
jgi:hypothetical protein